ncbi:MAG: diaminopimelate epimerase [Coxiella sp. (in: Bacteria)]|nr:MAG: diaminopimelate epimerase [Coxiella sp. (in: g-proteobacteria)]
MSIPFTKMHGLGNDFVVINALKGAVNLTKKQIVTMSDRRYGIGFDQLLIIEPSKHKEAQFHYRIHNADGSKAEQCGNGLRCVARYIFDHELADDALLTLSCDAGLVEAESESNNLIRVNMGSPTFTPELIPFKANDEQLIYNLDISGTEIHMGVLSMGNPHAVICVDDIDTVDIEQVGRAISENALFPNGINVGFMQVAQPYQACLTVYERGVGKTRACGSGACAAMVYGNKLGILDREVNVIQAGGDLIINWAGGSNPVYMTGPAENVYEGQWI